MLTKTIEDIIIELVKQNVIINKRTPKGLDSFRSVKIPKTQITGTNRLKGSKAGYSKERLFPVSEDPLQVSEEASYYQRNTNTSPGNNINHYKKSICINIEYK